MANPFQYDAICTINQTHPEDLQERQKKATVAEALSQVIAICASKTGVVNIRVNLSIECRPKEWDRYYDYYIRATIDVT